MFVMVDDDPLRPTIAEANADSTGESVAIVPPLSSPGASERYAREEVLGEGGMGAVFLCRDHRIGRRIALKTLQSGRAKDTHWRSRFLREAQVQGQLEHPAVVPVYDLGVEGDDLFFTM